jgi:hypothetical protein
VEEEAEKRRKQAAAEKLRALEESIAARGVPPVKPAEVGLYAEHDVNVRRPVVNHDVWPFYAG